MRSPRDGHAYKALVLGSDTRAFLSVVRSLGRSGVQVHAGCSAEEMAGEGQDKDSKFAMRSRHIVARHELPRYVPGNDSWKNAVSALMAEHAFDLVIPCSDPTLIPLQVHRQELEPLGKLYVLSEQAFEVLFDKHKTTELARAVGVRVPREDVATSPACMDRIRAEFELPIVLKPRASFTADDINARHTVRRAYSWEQFEKVMPSMLAQGPVAVQENFIGEGVGLELLLKEGKVLMAFQHVRLHEPLQGGGSSYRKSEPVSQDLLDAAVNMLGPMNYTGVAMVEFKRNPKSGDWVFIEVNARFWGSLPLALACGADFPMALFRLLVAGEEPKPRSFRTGICCRNFAKDLTWQVANLRADHNDPTLMTRPLGRVAREAVLHTLSLRERNDTLTIDDPAPGLTEAASLCLGMAGSLRRLVGRKLLSTPPMRRRLAGKARHSLANARSVLMLCKGNICRSPFAEYLAPRFLPASCVVSSAGTIEREGRMSPEVAVAAANRFGVDLTPHRSQTISDAMLAQTDAILVFDFDNYNRLIARYPRLRGRVHFAGALNVRGPLSISDPYGGTEDEFMKVYGQIEAALACCRGREAASAPREEQAACKS